MEGFSDGSSTLPASTKKKDTLIACLSFWASRAEDPLRPSAIEMLGMAEGSVKEFSQNGLQGLA